MAEPHQLGQAGHRDEDDGGGVWPESGDQGARPDRVLGKQDHLLRRPPLLSPGLLLDIQVNEMSSPRFLMFTMLRNDLTSVL